MRYSHTSKIIGTFLMIACLLTSSRALAHTSHVREAHGVIQSIDYQKRILTLAYVEGHGPQKLVWKPATKFLHDLKPVPPAELQPGTHITVYYHSPFFGKQFATKVVLDDNESP